MNWHADNGRWRGLHWVWDATCWDDGVAFLAEQRKTLPKDAEVRIACWPGLDEHGVMTLWLCLKWRVAGSPWQDTAGFDLSHICPPFCD